MKVRSVSTDELEDALDPDSSVWRRGTGELVKLMPTPLGMQPTEIIRETWKNRRYGITPEVRVRAIRDEATLAFHLEWSDPSKDDAVEDNDQFPDGAAVMLPVVPDAPMITMGWEEGPVEIWYWRADEAEGYARQVIGKGIGTSETISRNVVRANARWENGKWHVVLMRNLENDSEVKTAQLEPNGSTNFGVAIWQGSNGERAGLKAFSIEWRELVLGPVS